MEAHPDYIHVEMPRHVRLAHFHLTPLSPEFVEEDYEAVTSSAALLKGTFGGDNSDWPPDDLSLHGNRIDLSWHEREHTMKHSFSWIIRDVATAAYLGCAYVFPLQGRRGAAKVVTWIRAETSGLGDRTVLLDMLNGELKLWLEEKLATANVELEW
jgi:hypothetical protein